MNVLKDEWIALGVNVKIKKKRNYGGIIHPMLV
jgi:hypothetical protein